MAKRVKKDFRMELPRDAHISVGVVVEECGGNLVLTQLAHPGSSKQDDVSLSPAQCEALGITMALEDVPEPWERLRDALLQASAELGRTDSHPVYQLRHVELQRAAELLGIEPEGES